MSDEPESEQEESEIEPGEEFDLPDGRGILTDGHREFLLSQLDQPVFETLSFEGDTNQKRWRIRQRVRNGLHDFKYLDDPQMFSDYDLELTLEDVFVRDPSDPDEYRDLHPHKAGARKFSNVYGWGDQLDHLISAMGFLYRCADVVPMLSFENLIEKGVRQSVPRKRESPEGTGTVYNTSVSVDATVDVNVQWAESFDVDDIEAKMEQGEGLTRVEIAELFLHDRIAPGDIGADDLDTESVYGIEIPPEGYPGLDPSKPTPGDGWEEDAKENMSEEMIEKVDWGAAERSREAWDQLEEYYDDPIGRAMELNTPERREEDTQNDCDNS